MNKVILFAPPNTAKTLSFGGTEYAIKKGQVEVPFEALEHLQAHGFKTTEQVAYEETEAEAAAAAEEARLAQEKAEAEAAAALAAQNGNQTPPSGTGVTAPWGNGAQT